MRRRIAAVLFVLLSCLCRPVTVAAAAPDRPYRAAACDAAGWLRSVAIATPHGLVWPVDPEAGGRRADDLYSGSAGVVLFFAALARATGERGYLRDARRGADHLLATLPARVEGDEAGLYTGIAGIGFVLADIARATGEARYRRGTERVVEVLRTSARRVADGVEWSEVTDVVSGTAGIGLFLLDAGRSLDDPQATALAAAAGRRLLAQAEPTGEARVGRIPPRSPLMTRGDAPAHPRLRWRMTPDYPRIMPNFSHGTAGVAYFLASLYQATGDQAFLTAALAGARHLLAIGDVTPTSCRIHHHTPGGEELFYLGWCHGPAGTGRLFYRLYQVTGDEEWLRWLDRAAQAIVASGIPEKRPPGWWNNVGQCCGSAGVGAFLLAVDRVRGERRHRALVRRLADDLLARATPTAGGRRWIQAEHRVRPELLAAQTGFMQGAAGVGIFLLDLDAAEQGTSDPPSIPGQAPIVALPDSPF